MSKLGSDIKLAGQMAIAAFLTVLRMRRTRRSMMFSVTLAAMLVAFLGFTVLDNFLTEHPLLFIGYWLFCACMVIFMLMLALYDFAAVRGELSVRSERELAEVLKDIEQSAREGKAGGDNLKNDKE